MAVEQAVVGLVGRYASDPSPPFEPRVVVVGLELSPRDTAALVDALRAAWESTAPWEPSAELESKAVEWLERALGARGYERVHVHVTVLDGLPSQNRERRDP
jgi:hypothetical protein